MNEKILAFFEVVSIFALIVYILPLLHAVHL